MYAAVRASRSVVAAARTLQNPGTGSQKDSSLLSPSNWSTSKAFHLV